MAKKTVVTSHLEGISGDILENNPAAIQSLIKGKSGVYALYKNNSFYYIGLATNLMGRLKDHLKDKHSKKWNRFSVYLTIHDEHSKELESLVLRIVDPKGNSKGGKFLNATNLRRSLNVAIKAEHDDERARLMGGSLAIRRVKAKLANASRNDALKGLMGRRVQLKAWHKGYEYTASLRKNGTISYDGMIFMSPSAAAKFIAKRPANGWQFWKIKDKKGDWVQLRTLKR